MGTNCSICSCTSKDSELCTEVEFTSPDSQKRNTQLTDTTTPIPDKQTKSALRIQSLWRGYKDRKTLNLTKGKNIHSYYFITENSALRESQNVSIFERVKKPEHKFKSGATYTGE